MNPFNLASMRAVEQRTQSSFAFDSAVRKRDPALGRRCRDDRRDRDEAQQQAFDRGEQRRPKPQVERPLEAQKQKERSQCE